MINSIEKNEDLYNIEFISREYFEMHKDKCDKCQKYRVECAFSPHCTDRKHLNILIQLHTPKNERIFPNYCYSLHVKSIHNFLLGKEILTSSQDSWVYLEDFFNMFKNDLKKSKKKNDKELFLDLLNSWNQREDTLFLENDHEKKEEFTFIYNDVIFRVKFPTDSIIVDVNHRVCQSDEELETYLHLLRAFYHLDSSVSFIKDTKSLWYVSFSFHESNVERMKEKLSRFCDYYNISENDDGFEVTIDIKTSAHEYTDRKIQNYRNLRKIFK